MFLCEPAHRPPPAISELSHELFKMRWAIKNEAFPLVVLRRFFKEHGGGISSETDAPPLCSLAGQGEPWVREAVVS